MKLKLGVGLACCGPGRRVGEAATLRRFPRVTKSRGTIKQVLLDLLFLSRPLMWLVLLVPFGVGYLMARRQPAAGQGAAGFREYRDNIVAACQPSDLGAADLFSGARYQRRI